MLHGLFLFRLIASGLVLVLFGLNHEAIAIFAKSLGGGNLLHWLRLQRQLFLFVRPLLNSLEVGERTGAKALSIRFLGELAVRRVINASFIA